MHHLSHSVVPKMTLMYRMRTEQCFIYLPTLIGRRPVKIYIVYSITYNFKTWVKHYKCYTLYHFLTTQRKIYKFPQNNSVYFLLSLLSKGKLLIYQGFTLYLFLAFPSHPWMPLYQLFQLPVHLKSFPTNIPSPQSTNLSYSTHHKATLCSNPQAAYHNFLPSLLAAVLEQSLDNPYSLFNLDPSCK